MNSYRDLANTTLDQKKFLDECIFIVKEQSFYMKQAVENGSLRDTLKHASNMLCELRTSQLSPKYYYELYMLIFNELQHLDTFISDKKKHKKRFIDIYESVQHAGNIIPRLYLLIIVGRNYIKNKDIKAKYILKDMTELCKGIQHPLRGLFLRYFLIQMCKDRIPDTGSEYEEAGGGNIDDAFEFLLSNFYESIKLWSRMSDKVHIKLAPGQDEQVMHNNRNKVLREKMDVKMLVGSNLVRMSQLEGMTRQYYIEKCLPKLLQNLSTINDSLIQQYIFESIVQVFSDECHIYTLDILLNAILKTNSSLDFKGILITLLKRLRFFIESNKYEVPKEVDIFSLFYEHLVLYVNRTLDSYERAKGSYRSSFQQEGQTFPARDTVVEYYKGEEEKKKKAVSTCGTTTTTSTNVITTNNVTTMGTHHINENDLVPNCKIVKSVDAKSNPAEEKRTMKEASYYGGATHQGNNNKASNYGNLPRGTQGCYSNEKNNQENDEDDEFVEDIVKMLQVIYEFIFLCIRIYDDVITISKLFDLPYTIACNVNLNNDVLCEQIINIIVLPFNYLGISALKGKNMQALLRSITSQKHKKKLSLDIIDAIIDCKNKAIVYKDVEEILNYISPIFNEDVKRKTDPTDNSHQRETHQADFFNLENSTITYAAKKMCKFFHIITNTHDIDERYNICILFYKHIENGPYLVHLLPTIVFTMLDLVMTITNLAPSSGTKTLSQHDEPFEKKEHPDEELNDEHIRDEHTHGENTYDDLNLLSSNLGDRTTHIGVFPGNRADDPYLEDKIKQYNIYVKNILKFIHTNLLCVSSQIPMLALKLFLYSAVVVNNYDRFVQAHEFLSFENLEAICYEFITQPLIIYEEDINISSQQYNCIIWITGILCSHITLLQNENYENIALKLTQHANKLLKKKDQCLGILACSHIYWENKKYRNSAKVLECLQKCIRNAEIAVQSNNDNVVLFLFLLQKYVYYYEAQNIEVTEDSVHYLLHICQEEYSRESCDANFKKEFLQTVKYIHDKKNSSNAFAKIGLDVSVLR
ncbi:vacuolar protein sorting-associated protein 35, putative [Plasmodium knowlesi strain H]|uniref:Vacuolar protein sorting-associated protein 35 n=2 Tax=Plasmodium knowlesi TaxID=5850 RepID=B3L4Q7_PLAKH|nr:vacuolar protein sorting-associated protein 35, putative [Plasmodium knowlesi strain H]OTN64814.1 Vacuolar protein sorting-associated protein 35 [Plasmodium knowlesi]CAA9988129.1 vacuolar protein sorting-associated protein 35, putative [Plasmodium knowlesi strain H]VVS77603.1 vacuolar protein sorting-associated protein 35, putative [Plasmodium knowlesi strain H]|eukprot:XP_002259105.1 Vacuolar sorting protein 35, putative [Plasmodium knowlesi strain H]